MNAEDEIRKLINESKITTNIQTEKTVLTDALEYLDKRKLKNSFGIKLNIWRNIMKKPVIKIAVATIVIAVLLSFNPFNVLSTDSVAWGKITQNVEKIETFMFGLTIEVSDSDIENQADNITAKWIIYLSKDYGFRMDIWKDESVVSWYVAPDSDKMIIVTPDEKDFIEMPLPPDKSNQLPKEYQDPREYIKRFMSLPYKELGYSVIDGVKVEGIEVQNPPVEGGQLENGVGRLWVDTETELPVRIELSGTADGKMVQWILDFKWAEAVSPDLFNPYLTKNRLSKYSSDIIGVRNVKDKTIIITQTD
ncbi:MAG: hypothetical protein P8016_14630 [Sedimentisphaerales bacterium]